MASVTVHSRSLAHRLSVASTTLAFLIAVTILAGWELGFDPLHTLFHLSQFMAPTTGVLIVVTSLAVWLIQPGIQTLSTGIVSRLLGLFTFTFAGLTCLEYSLGYNFNIDTLFFRRYVENWTITPTPGRIAVQTAIAFTLLGAALLLIDLKAFRITLSELLASSALLICFLGVVGHSYGVKSLYGVMAPHTAFTVGLVSIGLLLARPNSGAVALFFAQNAAGMTLRRTVLTSTIALTLFGWIRLKFQRMDVVSQEAGTSLLVMASVIFVCALLIRTSFALNRLETEREQARLALLESESKYRSLFENTKEGIALYEPVLDESGQPVDWLIKDANPTFIAGSGFDRVHLVGHRLTELFSDTTALSSYIKTARDVYNSGRARQFESFFGPLGRYYIASVFPIAKRLYASTTIDITKSKQNEQQVRESEARYRQIVETASEGIWQLDENMRVTFVNERFAMMLGYEVREMIGLRKFDFVFPEDAPFVQSLFDARRSGNRAIIDIRMRHKNGSERWLMMAAAPIIGPSGEFRGALDMFTDITDRRAAVQALRDSEERFRQLANSMPQMVWTAVPDGTLDYCNRRWIEYTGLAMTDSKRWTWTSIVHPQDLPTVLERWQHALNTGTEFVAEARMRRESDASYRWHLTRAVPVVDASGAVTRWYGTSTNIHENKLSEEAMMKSEKLAATGRLAATIAHEINNPLEAVTNLIFLAQNSGVPDKSREFLELASEELQRVAHITKQTLGFYRETAAPASVQIGSLVNSVLSLYERKIESKEIVVKKRLQPTAEIEAIPGEIRQVFSNLISNALDALDRGGRIEVALREIKAPDGTVRGVRVGIADNGSGIPEEICQQVFEPFFTTKRDFGTGLGLWVTRQIVRRHGGEIRMRSRTSGKHRGTYFTVFLPAHSAEQHPGNLQLKAARV